jgi:hypothetical protein
MELDGFLLKQMLKFIINGIRSIKKILIMDLNVGMTGF